MSILIVLAIVSLVFFSVEATVKVVIYVGSLIFLVSTMGPIGILIWLVLLLVLK